MRWWSAWTKTGMRDSHGNKRSDYANRTKQDLFLQNIRKVPASSVPFGTDICVRGSSVWAVFDGDLLIAVTSTVIEARRKWRVYNVQKRLADQAAKVAPENLES